MRARANVFKAGAAAGCPDASPEIAVERNLGLDTPPGIAIIDASGQSGEVRPRGKPVNGDTVSPGH